LEYTSNSFFLIFGVSLLGAYSLGSILSEIGLPKITSYLLLGIIFGPYLFNFINFEMIKDLQFIDNIALSIIAFVAGGEINFRQKKVPFSKVIVFVILQLIMVFPLTLFFLFFIGKVFSIKLFLIIEPILFLSLLYNATSPSTTVAVIQETKAKGRLTDYVLISAVLKDIIIIILFTFLVAVTNTTSDVSVTKVITEEFLSAGCGVLLGVIVIFYIKNIKLHQGIFLFLLIIIITWLSKIIHLNNLMIFLFAGIVVNNLSNLGHSVVEIIENNSQFIYVIFFFIAGTSINLIALKTLWTITLIIFASRLVFLILTAYMSGRIIKEETDIMKYSGLGFVGQAGVTIGFSKIIADTFPEWGGYFQTLMLAVVGLNQIMGPIMFKFSLKKAKNI
jgi:Kef-type K+ transport system membrane component KefB